ncbi:MAG: hypothetical protein ACK5PF_02115 [bacterium]
MAGRWAGPCGGTGLGQGPDRADGPLLRPGLQRGPKGVDGGARRPPGRRLALQQLQLQRVQPGLVV